MKVFTTAMGRVLAAILIVTPAMAANDEVRNVVLVSWDGADRAVIRELLDAGKLPVTSDLIRHGSLQDITITSHKTVTMPGHATMLTGYLSDRHQIFNNDVVKPVPAGLTVFERLEHHLGTNAIATIMIAGKGRNLGGATTNDIFGLTRRVMDHFESKDQSAAQVVDLALPMLTRHANTRFILFLHFPDIDRAGHGYGRDSAQYRDAFVENDRQVGRVIEALKTANLHESTRTYITADHGFDKGSRGHDKAPDIFLATNDKAVFRGGNLADIPVTIMARMGLDTAAIEPPLAGRPLTGTLEP